jgi:hypothetical protein
MTQLDPLHPDPPDPDAPFRLGTGPGATAEADRLVKAGRARRVLDDVLAPADAPDSAALRAAAVAVFVGDALAAGVRRGPLAVGFDTAVWVHAGGPAPAEVALLATTGFRWRPVPRIRLRTSAALERADVVLIGGVRVTTPLRTAADIARTLPAPQARDVLERLRAACGVTPADVLDRLTNMPYARGVAGARKLVKSELRRRPGNGPVSR